MLTGIAAAAKNLLQQKPGSAKSIAQMAMISGLPQSTV